MRLSGNFELLSSASLLLLLAATSSQYTLYEQPGPRYNHPVYQHVPFLTKVRNNIVKAIWTVPEQRTSSIGIQSSPASSPSSRAVSRYRDDIVLRFTISSDEEARALRDATNTLFLDVWEFAATWADIRLAVDVVPSLLGLLPASLQDAHTPLMPSLASAILDTYPSSPSDDYSPPETLPFTHSTRASRKAPGETSIFFQNYQPLSVIHPWLRLLTSLFPTHTRVVNIGYSYEGREIPALRLGVHPTNSEAPLSKRQTILVIGGLHGREWVSTSSVNYIAYNLITSYGKTPKTTALLEKFDLIFIPTLNPDGYAYTWSTDRLWRKTRQQTSLRFCPGIDLDHTFPFEWDGAGTGSSPVDNNPCSESFPGEEPFEGYEARQLRDWIKNETESSNTKFIAALDFHSYSQQVLYPYAYSCEAMPRGLENLEELAIGIAKAIRMTGNGENYGVTSACEGTYLSTSSSSSSSSSQPPHQQQQKRTNPARTRATDIESRGGALIDYLYHDLNIPYTYQIKLRDTGAYGYLLPKTEIVPTGEEALAVVEFVGRWLKGDRGHEGIKSQNGVFDGKSKEDEDERKEARRRKAEAAKESAHRWRLTGFDQDEGVMGIITPPVLHEEEKEEEEAFPEKYHEEDLLPLSSSSPSAEAATELKRRRRR